MTAPLEDLNALKQEVEELKKLLAEQRAQPPPQQQTQREEDDSDVRSVTFTDFESTTEKESSESDMESGDKAKTKRKRRKKDLKALLKSHQRIIKGMATAINEKGTLNETVAAELNNLSKSHVNHAIRKNNSKFSIEGQNIPSPPKLREKGHAEMKVLREAIQSLKDLYKHAFSGDEGEDVLGLLQNVSQLAHNCNLSIEQFYLLLKSRINMGTTLYTEVTHHYNQKSPPRVLYKEIIPAYSTDKHYLTYLNKMTNFKPQPNDSAKTIFAKIKSIAIQMADSTPTTQKDEFILSRVRDKILTLFPNLAHLIIERELSLKPTNIGEFAQIFLGLAPLVDHSNKKFVRPTIHEVVEEPTIHEISSSLPIKLTRTQAQLLDGKCFKCANENPDQGPHFGRDCIWYKDTPLAIMFCRRCDKAVHLPKFCKQSPDSIQQIEIIDSSDLEELEKN